MWKERPLTPIASLPDFVYDGGIACVYTGQTAPMREPTPSPEALQRRLAVLNRLVEVSLVLNSTLELNPLLRFIMDAAKELADAEDASILLTDRHTHELVFTATSSGGTQDLIGKPVPQEGSIAGFILREDRPVAIDDVRGHPLWFRQMDEQTAFETRSLLGVPMRIKDEAVGVLEVVNKLEGSWTPEDTNSMSILAAQAAVAIENTRLVEALQEAYAELSQLDKLKNDFIAIASHELRTPLGVILGYAAFLRDEAEGDAHDHADAVFRSALKLRGIIEQMTNLRYLQIGEAEIVRERVTIGELLETARQDIETMAVTKGHTLTISEIDADLIVYVDRHKVGTALSNVLNNAVRFTPDGGSITVEAQQKGAELWIAVQDNGIGIAPEHLDRIFDEFFQVEDHMTRRYGGMGLGLSIARALVEANGGRIWAESDGMDQGCTVYVSLPLVI
ncbi:MAG: GAF domain-containing protein [Anaerolineae bacterium]|nr:GAF domain-containing protein [Anaerolineae bacterium]